MKPLGIVMHGINNHSTDPLPTRSQAQTSALNEVNEDLHVSLAESCARHIHVYMYYTFPLFDIHARSLALIN